MFESTYEVFPLDSYGAANAVVVLVQMAWLMI
jgi:hypothetical protein